jgi:hypothetical protein
MLVPLGICTLLFKINWAVCSLLLNTFYCKDEGHRVLSQLHLFIYFLFLNLFNKLVLSLRFFLATGDINNEQDSHIFCHGTCILEEGELIDMNNEIVEQSIMEGRRRRMYPTKNFWGSGGASHKIYHSWADTKEGGISIIVIKKTYVQAASEECSDPWKN